MKRLLMEEDIGKRRHKHRRSQRPYVYILSILLVVIWVLVIWSFSTQSYQQQTIQPLLHKWAPKLNIGFALPDVHFTYGEHEYSLRQRPYDFAEFIFRKSAHLFIYAVLAGLVYGSLRYRKMRMWACIAAALTVVAIIASIDEYIQQFSPNRTSSIRDVGVDLLGGCGGIAVVMAIRTIRRTIRSTRYSPVKRK
ncbi:VanZ family protein [Paenibacillus pabuli]|uniref:VanZ family protein n=1 Tax=Paenibacillus pabuli TaxID=1472 RepID=UPI001C3F1A95|nr:VanZ family protein [Paenibacillus pabuli]MEC0123739.1 VanZ family protein [Paenibacillus pabuli]